MQRFLKEIFNIKIAWGKGHFGGQALRVYKFALSLWNFRFVCNISIVGSADLPLSNILGFNGQIQYNDVVLPV